MIEEIRIPEISENVTSGNVVDVLVETGDEVDVDDPIIEFETEKAVVEIPSPYHGRITEVLVKNGDELTVGDVIAKVDTEAGAAGEKAEEEPEGKREKTPKDETRKVEEEGKPRQEEPLEDAAAREKTERKEAAEKEKPEGDEREEFEWRKEKPTRKAAKEHLRDDVDERQRGPAPASPSVRRFARELGVDIYAVRPAGSEERITEADVQNYVKNELTPEDKRDAAPPAAEPAGQSELPDFGRWGEVDIRELTGVRRLTAESMAVAWRTVAHVTQFERVDITAVMEFVSRNADLVADRGGKLTITAVLMKVCASALMRFPQFNASIDPANNRLIVKKYVHIGLAVDTPRGLLVPVVRNADRRTILDLAVDIVDLARRARNKKITPDEMEGGTFTISNQGGIGGTNFTPVVYWPQAAILGVSRAATQPRYLDGEWRPRQILPLALSYDHRIADGADAARFVSWIRRGIEDPLTLHLD